MTPLGSFLHNVGLTLFLGERFGSQKVGVLPNHLVAHEGARLYLRHTPIPDTRAFRVSCDQTPPRIQAAPGPDQEQSRVQEESVAWISISVILPTP